VPQRDPSDGKYRAEKAHSYHRAPKTLSSARALQRRRHGASGRLLRRKWSAKTVSGVLKKRGTLRISTKRSTGASLGQESGRDLCANAIMSNSDASATHHDSRGVLPASDPWVSGG